MNSYVEAIERLSEAVAVDIDGADLSIPVPSCPEWVLGDLVSHLGNVQKFWAVNLLTGDAQSRRTLSEAVTDTENTDLAAWLRSCTAALAAALRVMGDHSPCWTWWGEPRTSGAVARHQVQEVAIHRWDVGLALGRVSPIEAAPASDGVSELLAVHAEELLIGPDLSIVLTATDTYETWRIGDGTGAPIEVGGPASDLVLLLNGRIPLSRLSVSAMPERVRAVLDSIDLD